MRWIGKHVKKLKALHGRKDCKGCFHASGFPRLPSSTSSLTLILLTGEGEVGGRGVGAVGEGLSVPVIKHVGTELLPAAASGRNYQRGPK